MLSLKNNQQRQPIGGHHYPTHGKTFKSDTFQGLIAEVKKFRLDNSLPFGDPEQEILYYYAEKFPFMVKSDPDRTAIQKDPDYLAWRNWVWDSCKKFSHKFLTQKEAEERQSACAKCPYNKPITWTGEEAKQVGKKSFILRRCQQVMPLVGFCTFHKWDNRVSCFTEDAKIFSKQKQDKHPPANCWIKL